MGSICFVFFLLIFIIYFVVTKCGIEQFSEEWVNNNNSNIDCEFLFGNKDGGHSLIEMMPSTGKIRQAFCLLCRRRRNPLSPDQLAEWTTPRPLNDYSTGTTLMTGT